MTEFDFIPQKFVIVSETEPEAFEGLIWYNPNEKLWRMYKDGKWQILIPFYVGDSEPTEKTDGMLWYDTLNDVMKIWDAGAAAWQRLGIDWADIVNKPDVYPPDYTNYPPDWNDLINKPDAFKPDYANYPPDWNDLINKPSVFPPDYTNYPPAGHYLWGKLPDEYDSGWNYLENITDYDETTYAEITEASTNEHYVLYDLGRKLPLELYAKVEIGGVLEGTTAKISVSDDKSTWTEVDSYTEKSDNQVEVELSGFAKARYVKLSIQKGSSPERTHKIFMLRA